MREIDSVIERERERERERETEREREREREKQREREITASYSPWYKHFQDPGTLITLPRPLPPKSRVCGVVCCVVVCTVLCCAWWSAIS